MHVVVCGANGSTGRQVVAQALERGWSVTATDIVDPHVEPSPHVRVRVTDLVESSSVDAVASGADAVISVIATPSVGTAHSTLYASSARNLVRAAGRSRCRLVFCTSSALGGSVSRDPWIQDHIIEPLRRWGDPDDMATAERILADSDADWVVVRPGRLHDRPPLGAVRATPELRPELGTALARGDLARFLLDQVTSDDWLRRTAVLSTPWD